MGCEKHYIRRATERYVYQLYFLKERYAPLLRLLRRLLRFIKEGICTQRTEGIRASISSKSSRLQSWLRLERICSIRSRVAKQTLLLGLLLLLCICSESTKTERILLGLLCISRVRGRSKSTTSKNACWWLLLLLLLLCIARVRSRSKCTSENACGLLLLLLLLRLLLLSKETSRREGLLVLL